MFPEYSLGIEGRIKVNRESSKREIWLLLLVLGFLCLPLAAQGIQSGKMDYTQVRAPIQSFEGLIGQVISATLQGTFGVVQKPKGASIDSGYIFTFLVNLNRGMIYSPMGKFADPRNITQEMKKKSIDDMKDLLIKLLYSQGSTMPLMRKDQSVTIVAFFEEITPEYETLNKTLILSVLKSDIDEFSTRQDGFNEFKQRVKIREY
jgi:hypothetical protein